jgi:hypothetical protein
MPSLVMRKECKLYFSEYTALKIFRKLMGGGKEKMVKLSLKQVVEAHTILRYRGSHTF